MFRKKKPSFVVPRYVPNFKEKRISHTASSGTVDVLNVVSSDSDSDSLPPPENFTLAACKKAGVNLDPVNSRVLPITDESVIAESPLFAEKDNPQND